jgi:hypothetical protein
MSEGVDDITAAEPPGSAGLDSLSMDANRLHGERPACYPGPTTPATDLRQQAHALGVNLLIGRELSEQERNAILDDLRRMADVPLFFPQREKPFQLPDQDSYVVILDDASSLPLDDQRICQQWLDHHRSRVVSFTTKPLFALVSRGDFLERLFYRLNIVTEG